MTIDNELFVAQLTAALIVVTFLCWLVWHEFRHARTEADIKAQDMRIVKMENYPSHEDRIRKLEAAQAETDKLLSALKSNSFTSETLKRVR